MKRDDNRENTAMNFIDKILPKQPASLLFRDRKFPLFMSVFPLRTALSALPNKAKTVKAAPPKGSVECCPVYGSAGEKGIDFVDI